MSPSRQRAWADEITLPPVPLSVQRARTFVADRLAVHQPEVGTDDLCLVTSELASNALLHARTPFTVIVRGDTEGISLAVKDGLSWFFSSADAHDENEQGRGLLVTEQLSDAWGMRPGAYGSKYVWAFFAHEGSTRPGFLPRRGRQEPGEPAAVSDDQGPPWARADSPTLRPGRGSPSSPQQSSSGSAPSSPSRWAWASPSSACSPCTGPGPHG